MANAVSISQNRSADYARLIGHAGSFKTRSVAESFNRFALDCLSATVAVFNLLTLGNAGRLNSRYPNAVSVAESGNSLRFYCAATNGAGFDLFALMLTVGSKNGFPFAGVVVMGGNLNRLAE